MKRMRMKMRTMIVGKIWLMTRKLKMTSRMMRNSNSWTMMNNSFTENKRTCTSNRDNGVRIRKSTSRIIPN